MTPPADMAGRLAALPVGTIRGRAMGKTYIATKSVFNDGRSIKLVAEEPGGTGYISFNFYDLERGARLYPCEMPAEKVIAFLRNFDPE